MKQDVLTVTKECVLTVVFHKDILMFRTDTNWIKEGLPAENLAEIHTIPTEMQQQDQDLLITGIQTGLMPKTEILQVEML